MRAIVCGAWVMVKIEKLLNRSYTAQSVIGHMKVRWWHMLCYEVVWYETVCYGDKGEMTYRPVGLEGTSDAP